MGIDYKKLEKEVKEIVKICEAIPDPYRIKCFEALMGHLLIPTSEEKIPEKKESDTSKSGPQIVLPIDVRALFQQYSIDEKLIEKLFFIEGGEIRSIYNIPTIKKSQAQMQVALLVALENTIKNPNKKFEFSAEQIRQKCIDLQCYDLANFAKHFKSNKDLFKSLDDLENISLSADGKAELAETITQITNDQSRNS